MYLPVGTPRLSGSGLGREIILLLVLGLTGPLVVDTNIVIKVRHHEAREQRKTSSSTIRRAGPDLPLRSTHL